MGSAVSYRTVPAYPQAPAEIAKYEALKQKIEDCIQYVGGITPKPSSLKADQFANSTLQGEAYDRYLSKVGELVQEYTDLYKKLTEDFSVQLENCKIATQEKIDEWTRKSLETTQVPV